MSEGLLTRIRKLNWVLSESATGYVSFEELCNIMYDLVASNVYIINKRGKVLAARFNKGDEVPLVYDKKTEMYLLPSVYNEKYMEIEETKENLIYDAIKEYNGQDYTMSNKFHTIVPVSFGGKRVATMVFVRPSKAYSDEDIAICEYGATVVGIEVARGIALEEEEDNRQRNAVINSLESLSYSEVAAVESIFEELDGDEGLLVASKVADKSGITRSVIVNALRKLESAGIIETRSLGMKGTRIKIVNEYLREELERSV